ncbi:MAG: hypothetical protein MR609_07005 [Bacteroidales bacterium]|nr:hypothetical protein [Bacteroidales bacterium]
MKEVRAMMADRGVWGLFLMVLGALIGTGGVIGAEGAVVGGTGAVATDEAMSLQHAMEFSPEIVRATIDKEVTVIKPHLTPLYTIAAQHGTQVKGTSPQVLYDEIELLPLDTKVKTTFQGGKNSQMAIDLEDNDMVAINETLYFKGIPGYVPGTTTEEGYFVAYVKDKDSTGKPIIVPVTGKGDKNNFPESIPQGTVVIRGARTASEKQSRTAPLAATPSQKENFMQKMIIETEETTFFRMAQAGADVKWGKTEVTDFAISEHKRTVEADMLIGKKNVLRIANKYNQNKLEDTWFMEGIYWQAGRDVTLPKTLKREDLISMMKVIFTGNNSSNSKIFFVGSDLMEAIHKIEYNQVIYPGTPKQVLGLDIQEVIYGQYSLMLVNEPAFDDLLMSDCGLVVDEDYLKKFAHPWRAVSLDNLKNGESDSQSEVYIDTFCLVLKNPKAHARVHLVSDEKVTPNADRIGSKNQTTRAIEVGAGDGTMTEVTEGVRNAYGKKVEKGKGITGSIKEESEAYTIGADGSVKKAEGGKPSEGGGKPSSSTPGDRAEAGGI